MKFMTTIAVLVTSVALTACASQMSTETEAMKPEMTDAKMMDGKHAMKDAKMMDGKHAMKDDKMMKADTMMKKDASCHDHAANSMTKSSNHCHKSNQADHSHKYGG